MTYDVVSRMEEKEKRIRKEDSCWQRQGSFKKERWLRKVGVLRRNGQERDTDIVLQREKGKGIQTVETEKSLRRKRKIRRVTGNGTRRIARILNKSEMDGTRGRGTIWEGVRCAGVKPGGCNW